MVSFDLPIANHEQVVVLSLMMEGKRVKKDLESELKKINIKASIDVMLKKNWLAMALKHPFLIRITEKGKGVLEDSFEFYKRMEAVFEVNKNELQRMQSTS